MHGWIWILVVTKQALLIESTPNLFEVSIAYHAEGIDTLVIIAGTINANKYHNSTLIKYNQP